MRRLMCLVVFINFLLFCMPELSTSYAAPKVELQWDHLVPHENDRNLDTVSLHILEKISETKNRSVYRGITITRPRGDITTKEQGTLESSAVGVGPIYMVRNERYHSGKLTAAIDMSGGFLVYDQKFPAGGQYYNFMWRVGPQLIYKFNENSSVNIGYMLMHVSNGLRTHNPAYNARGVSFGFVTKF